MGKYKFNPQTGKMESAASVDAPQKIANIQPQQPKPQKTDEIKLVNDVDKRRANVVVDEGVVSFREKSDLTIFQIIDETTGIVMAYISGYALDINFNMEELRSVESVEQLISGIGKMFRSVIMDKIFTQKKTEG